MLARADITERNGFLQNPARRVQRGRLRTHCRAEEVYATVRPLAFERSPHFVRVGLYFMGCPVHSVPAQLHKTEPRFQGMQYKNAASLRPKGSLSLTRMNSKKTAPVKYPATHNSQSQTTHQYLGYCLKSPTENHLFQKNMDEPAVPQ